MLCERTPKMATNHDQQRPLQCVSCAQACTHWCHPYMSKVVSATLPAWYYGALDVLWSWTKTPYWRPQVNHAALRAFFEAFCKAFQHWEPTDDASLRFTPPPSPKTSPKATLVTVRGASAGPPGPSPVRGCAAAHPQPVLRALVGALDTIPSEFNQGASLMWSIIDKKESRTESWSLSPEPCLRMPHSPYQHVCEAQGQAMVCQVSLYTHRLHTATATFVSLVRDDICTSFCSEPEGECSAGGASGGAELVGAGRPADMRRVNSQSSVPGRGGRAAGTGGGAQGRPQPPAQHDGRAWWVHQYYLRWGCPACVCSRLSFKTQLSNKGVVAPVMRPAKCDDATLISAVF